VRRDGSEPGGAARRALVAVALWALAVACESAPRPCAGEPSDCLPDCRAADAWPSGWVALEAAALDEINAHRALGGRCVTQGLPFDFAPAPALGMDPAARTAARCHSADMVTAGALGHRGSDGSTFSQRLAEAGYSGAPASENVAAGYATAASVVAAWLASEEGHCNALRDPFVTEVGVGYVARDGDASDGWWTADFGRRP
jgi:uncharacterized protein YkwD